MIPSDQKLYEWLSFLNGDKTWVSLVTKDLSLYKLTHKVNQRSITFFYRVVESSTSGSRSIFWSLTHNLGNYKSLRLDGHQAHQARVLWCLTRIIKSQYGIINNQEFANTNLNRLLNWNNKFVIRNSWMAWIERMAAPQPPPLVSEEAQLVTGIQEGRLNSKRQGFKENNEVSTRFTTILNNQRALNTKKGSSVRRIHLVTQKISIPSRSAHWSPWV